jgi:hypothetical protein
MLFKHFHFYYSTVYADLNYGWPPPSPKICYQPTQTLPIRSTVEHVSSTAELLDEPFAEPQKITSFGLHATAFCHDTFVDAKVFLKIFFRPRIHLFRHGLLTELPLALAIIFKARLDQAIVGGNSHFFYSNTSSMSRCNLQAIFLDDFSHETFIVGFGRRRLCWLDFGRRHHLSLAELSFRLGRSVKITVYLVPDK